MTELKIDLDALERTALAAKPGKWTWKQVGTFSTPGCAILWPDTSKGGVHYRRIDSGGGMEQADADFIASANPSAILELIRRLREAESELAACMDDAERWKYARRKICFTGNGDGTCMMHGINLPAAIPGWPDPGKVEEFCDAAIDAARSKGGA